MQKYLILLMLLLLVGCSQGVQESVDVQTSVAEQSSVSVEEIRTLISNIDVDKLVSEGLILNVSSISDFGGNVTEIEMVMAYKNELRYANAGSVKLLFDGDKHYVMSPALSPDWIEVLPEDFKFDSAEKALKEQYLSQDIKFETIERIGGDEMIVVSFSAVEPLNGEDTLMQARVWFNKETGLIHKSLVNAEGNLIEVKYSYTFGVEDSYFTKENH